MVCQKLMLLRPATKLWQLIFMMVGMFDYFQNEGFVLAAEICHFMKIRFRLNLAHVSYSERSYSY